MVQSANTHVKSTVFMENAQKNQTSANAILVSQANTVMTPAKITPMEKIAKNHVPFA